MKRTTTLLVRVIVHALSAVAVARSQAPISVDPQLTPQAAYEQATRPLDIVRRDPQNWSEIELAALKNTTAEAKAACVQRTASDFTGEDLLAYARLCTLGQAWLPVQQAATLYLHGAPVTPTRSLATAFDYQVQATLRLQQPEPALLAAQAMLRAVPYDDLVSEATNAAARYLQLTHTYQVLDLLKQRQPILLATIQSPRPPLPLHTLFTEALALPTMLQFTAQPELAALAVSAIEKALPPTLSLDDSFALSQGRRRYQLLGHPLPNIKTFAWLLDPNALGIPPQLNSPYGAATVLLLFPNWCNQCVALHPTFSPIFKRLRDEEVRFFALLAQPEAPPKASPKEVASHGSAKSPRPAPFPNERPDIPHVDLQLAVKPTAAALLVGTPTFVVPSSTVDEFLAADFPLLVVTDHSGIIRAIQPATENATVPGGLADQLADHVLSTWPRSPAP